MRTLRLMLTYPSEAFVILRGRILCRVFHRHGRICEGRTDHRPRASIRGRWRRPRGRYWF